MPAKVLVPALALLALAAAFPALAAPPPVDLTPYLRRNGFVDARLSPDGTRFAATVAREDHTALVVVRRADRKATASFSLGAGTHIQGFAWASDERLVVSMAERFGALETPLPTGELYAVNVDGSKPRLLVGLRATGDDEGAEIVGERFNARAVAAYLLDPLDDDPRNVLIAAWPMTRLPTPRVERLDIHTGKRRPVAEAPVPRAEFITDPAGKVRFASGADDDNVRKLYHRPADGGDWVLVNDQGASGRIETPLGFDAAGAVAWLRSSRADGPDAVVAWDSRTGERREVLRDAELDPWQLAPGIGAGRPPVGVVYTGASVRTAYFDDAAADAKRLRALAKGFGGLPVVLASSSADGRYALALSWSGDNPGDFFLFDTQEGKAERMLSRREWIDPAKAAEVTPIRVEARDGLQLDGFLTRRRGTQGPLPLVVLPHGGPIGVFDRLAYDDDAQLLAAAGYAVLQVNFRGSGNRGQSFREAAARQWGAKMQDDLTYATRWAITQSIADPERICLVGGSYGAYAAMMGLAREPDLYRCGVGYIGVYDLERMARDPVRNDASGATYMREWVGESDALRAASATTHAAKIVDPVLLVAGGRDRIAPEAHTRAMEAALRAAGAPVETLYVDDEGHGFFAEANRRRYATRLLDFLAGHLGGARARAD